MTIEHVIFTFKKICSQLLIVKINSLLRSFAKYSEPTIKNQVCSKSSEGFKFQESCSENNNYQSSRGHLYQYQG